jgi:hypothetical protein
MDRFAEDWSRLLEACARREAVPAGSAGSVV